MRYRLFEFEDQQWFPDVIRRSMTDYLRYLLGVFHLYQPAAALVMEGVEQTGATQVVDLCSGSGGAIEQIQREIERQFSRRIPVVLSDKFPNCAAYALLEEQTGGRIAYCEQPVDATDVPGSLKGFRTVFSAFHHFDTGTARDVIGNAVKAGEGIAVFDGGDKHIGMLLLILLVHPLVLLLGTPFFKPFRWSRIWFTYLIPLIPFCTIWDGWVSVLRLYSPGQMLQLAQAGSNGRHYVWKTGRLKNKWGMRISYLLGYPASAATGK
jgi:hypothetical protein